MLGARGSYHSKKFYEKIKKLGAQLVLDSYVQAPPHHSWKINGEHTISLAQFEHIPRHYMFMHLNEMVSHGLVQCSETCQECADQVEPLHPSQRTAEQLYQDALDGWDTPVSGDELTLRGL